MFTSQQRRFRQWIMIFDRSSYDDGIQSDAVQKMFGIGNPLNFRVEAAQMFQAGFIAVANGFEVTSR